MQKTITGLLSVLLCGILSAQQKDFEGVITYKVEIKSKKEGISENYLTTVLALGDITVASVKQGNYRRTSRISETYYIPKEEKVYLKFRKIDTLYYLDYSSDTASVLNVSRSDEQKIIEGHTCKEITIKTSSSTSKYFYSPELHINPDYDRNNKFGRFDIYTKETGSVWLSLFQETKTYYYSETCTRIEAKTVSDNTFELPKLPLREFSEDALIEEPEFSRAGGWRKYLETNLKAELGAKYLKIPRGESEVIQTVKVGFVISESGEVTDINVLNKKEVHPKLAEEAVRVVAESRGWKPATIYGEKVRFYLQQPVTFYVSK